MATKDVKVSESTVEKIVNLAEEAKLARQEIKPKNHIVICICKSLVVGGVKKFMSSSQFLPVAAFEHFPKDIEDYEFTYSDE
ncbi:hypothetical protein HAX54_015306, partial [Datura stramonium]|nr:hypothetical protein [Datura stramonium]